MSLLLLATVALARKETTEEMMYADFARESFKHPGHRRDLHGYKNFKVADLKLECYSQYGLDPVTFALWTNDKQKEVVFGLRGTPLSNLVDLSPDDEGVLNIAEGNFTTCDRAKKALKTLRAIEAQFPGYKITITGHSLGGTTALILLAQDAHNDIIETESDRQETKKYTSLNFESSITAVYVYNPYRGGITGLFTPMEPFYKLAFQDDRTHGIFVFGDLLSKYTKLMAQKLLPPSRLYIGQVPNIWERFPPLSYLFAHNMDGTKGTCQLTSPDYSFGDEESK